MARVSELPGEARANRPQRKGRVVERVATVNERRLMEAYRLLMNVDSIDDGPERDLLEPDPSARDGTDGLKWLPIKRPESTRCARPPAPVLWLSVEGQQARPRYVRNSRTAASKAAGLSRPMECPAPGISTNWQFGIAATISRATSRRRTGLSAPRTSSVGQVICGR